MAESWSDLAKQLFWEMNPQDNWHGTPYTFNKFDDSRFLTGEGAAAHGPGHYSADSFNVANTKYKKPSIVLRNGTIIPVDEVGFSNSFGLLDDDTKAFQIKNKISEYEKLLKDTGYPKGIRDRFKNKLDILQNIEKVLPGNTYRVNVPNENFMWREGRWLPEQSEYIQNLWKNRNIDFSKYLSSGVGLEHDLEGIYSKKLDSIFQPMFEQMEYGNGLDDATRKLFNEYMNELSLDNQLKFMERSGNVDKINEITKGIKGKRAIGMEDGPINITFSGKDIKMANTPWQRFVNRIPTQTLGKMASKIYNTPGVRPTLSIGGKALGVLGALDMMGLNQPVGEGSDIVPQYPVDNTLYGYINNY